jgi:hypothetical protein
MIALSVYPEVNRTRSPGKRLCALRASSGAPNAPGITTSVNKVDRRTAFDNCHRAFRT